MRRRISVALVLLVGAIAVLWWRQPAEPIEPVYQGKSLSAWLDERRQTPQREFVLSDEAIAAVRVIGAAAVPSLVAWIGLGDSTLVRESRRLPGGLALSDHQAERTRAMYGLRALGPAARLAWPALVAIFLHSEDGRQATDAINSLTQSDAATMLLFAQGLRHPDPDVRLNAISALKFLRIAPDEVCLPALEALGSDPDPMIRKQASKAVAFINAQMAGCVPLLADSDPQTRGAAARTIGSYRTRARAFLPDLEAAQADTEPAVRAAVIEAIAQVRGQ